MGRVGNCLEAVLTSLGEGGVGEMISFFRDTTIQVPTRTVQEIIPMSSRSTEHRPGESAL